MKYTLLFTLIAFSCLIFSKVEAQATYSGSIINDMTWSGNVTVTSNVTVEQGVTLTILPGTIIDFQWSVSGNFVITSNLPVSYTHLTLPTIYSV